MVPVHGNFTPVAHQQQHYYPMGSTTQQFASQPRATAKQPFDDGAVRAATSVIPSHNHNSQSLGQVPDLMSHDTAWLGQSQQQQAVPRAAHRFGHHRESSLSSLGSNGPASPFNPSTSNPHIAITDSSNDGFHDLTGSDGNYSYQMGAKSVPENLFIGAPMPGAANAGQTASGDDFPNISGPCTHRPRESRGGLGAVSDVSTGGSSSSRSHPVSVASSAAGDDSPTTPSLHDLEDDIKKQQRTGEISPLVSYDAAVGDTYLQYPHTPGAHNVTPSSFSHGQSGGTTCHPRTAGNGSSVPKLDRTMTDVYDDELYNPNFSFTAAPQPQQPLAMSPTNDLFAQRLQAANSQHLSAAQSPVSSVSRDRSPFAQSSPFSAAMTEFSSQPSVGSVHFASAQQQQQQQQQQREQIKADQDVNELQQQLVRSSAQPQGTPNTISPKDAMLDFKESDDTSNFPLFPPQDASDFAVGQLGNTNLLENNNNTGNTSNSKALMQQPTPSFTAAIPGVSSSFNFSMPAQLAIPPQQYPFVRQPQQQMTPASSNLSRVGSEDTCSSDLPGVGLQRPARTSADSGTYTCTYHGCTMRFETPTLLQKHKREGHRQVNAMSSVRTMPASDGSPGGVVNTQAGPHRCDRINPSTGKSCNTVFSRPYDLTRHEDTIHNARKQKVRCDLCDEEKTFSRADALTRHYRVCHPDHEVPGKHRRRVGIPA